MKKKTIVCGLGARCTSWGESWKRHWYDKKTKQCYRCGTHRDQA